MHLFLSAWHYYSCAVAAAAAVNFPPYASPSLQLSFPTPLDEDEEKSDRDTTSLSPPTCSGDVPDPQARYPRAFLAPLNNHMEPLQCPETSLRLSSFDPGVTFKRRNIHRSFNDD